MRYYRVSWIDTAGQQHLSDPLTRWTDAEMYRRAIGDHAAILIY